MPTKVRVEWITLGLGGWAENVIKDWSDGVTLDVSTTATDAGDRPTAPTGGDVMAYARLTATGGPVYAAKGADPTANLANSLRLANGIPEVVGVMDGHKLSFITDASDT